MSKALSATCSNGEVTCEGVVIEDAEILSEGVGESEGVLLLEEGKQTYIAKTSPDLKTTLEKVIAALNHVVTGLNAAGAALDGLSGGAGTPVTAAATQVTTVVTEITTLKEGLK